MYQNMIKFDGHQNEINQTIYNISSIERPIDFEKILPCPIKDVIEYDSMASLVYNSLFGFVGEDDLIFHELSDMNMVLRDFKNIDPRDLDTIFAKVSKMRKNVLAHGHWDIDSWKCSNWGMKHNVVSQFDSRDTNNTIYFKTEDFPFHIIKNIFKNNKDISATMQSYALYEDKNYVSKFSFDKSFWKEVKLVEIDNSLKSIYRQYRPTNDDGKVYDPKLILQAIRNR